jgi:DNA invertase Pin-like site-specific DNA recombinase
MGPNRLATSVLPAEYVRMSTDHQKYSTANQSDTIRTYAARRNMEIVRTYADEGKSGLSLDRRDALKKLIEDVQSGIADFKAILVYDVSRWGRFQDADESAYYEYICKRAGIGVHYCAEQFDNDGSPLSAIIKSIKRAMAGEYSRELSVKVFNAQCRIVQLGFRLGGQSGYGRSGPPWQVRERGGYDNPGPAGCRVSAHAGDGPLVHREQCTPRRGQSVPRPALPCPKEGRRYADAPTAAHLTGLGAANGVIRAVV